MSLSCTLLPYTQRLAASAMQTSFSLIYSDPKTTLKSPFCVHQQAVKAAWLHFVDESIYACHLCTRAMLLCVYLLCIDPISLGVADHSINDSGLIPTPTWQLISCICRKPLTGAVANAHVMHAACHRVPQCYVTT